MTTSNCTVPECTKQTHGRTYCGNHRDQIRKGFTPGEAPDRYVDAGTVVLLSSRETRGHLVWIVLLALFQPRAWTVRCHRLLPVSTSSLHHSNGDFVGRRVAFTSSTHTTLASSLISKAKHSMLQLGRLLGVSARTVARAAAPANVKIERTLAEAIRFIAGEDFAPVASIEPVTGADVAAFALTDSGREFIARCRRPKIRKVVAA